MSEKLQKILQEINSGARKHLYDIDLSAEELLSKDDDGKTFLRYLLDKKIWVGPNIRKNIKNNIEIAYIYAEAGETLYYFKLSEEDLFSIVNGQTYIEYFASKSQLNEDMISVVYNHVEIIDIIVNCNKTYLLKKLTSEIINKLMEKNPNGVYGIEKYASNDRVFNELISLISNPNVLLELCKKYNDYSLLRLANEKVLMWNTSDNKTFLHYVVNEKKIIPTVLESISADKEFIDFLISNELYDYLVNASESAMLLKVEKEKTLLEFLIDKGYSDKINLNIWDEKILEILRRKNKLEIASKVSESILKKPANQVLNIDASFENLTLLEYMLDKGYNPLEKSYSITDENIIDIIYQKQRLDLLGKANVVTLINKGYFEYILESIKNNNVKISLNKLYPYGNDIDIIARYYISIAKCDMMSYVRELTVEKLLEEHGGITLIEKMLELDMDITVKEILSETIKANPQIAALLKANGIEIQQVDVSPEEQQFADEYLRGVQNTFGIGPLSHEGEQLLDELEQLFLSDGKSDMDLISALISGYRHALFVNYELHLSEIKNLITVKKNNFNKFYYIKINDGAYFLPGDGSIYCDNLVVETLLHETGHALHYYLTNNYIPENYLEVILNARNNPDTLRKIDKYAEDYHRIKENILLLVEQKYKNFFESYYDEEKRNEIKGFLEQEILVKKDKFRNLGISDEQLDIILNGMFTVEEYIEHQKRIFINQNADAIFRSEFGTFMAIADILDAICEGKLHSGILTNQQGEKIKGTAGHGVAYYYATSHGFDEMVANFAYISKSNDAIEKLELFKSIVGEELYNMLSEFYYQNISYGRNGYLEVEKEAGESNDFSK